MTPLTLGVGFLAGGVMLAGDLLGLLHIGWVSALAVELVVVGLGVIASAWLGRGWGLLALGVALAVVAVPASTVHLPGDLVGNNHWSPAVLSPAEPLSYYLGVGNATLDLRRSQLTGGGRPDELSAHVGVGNLVVLVPQDVAADIEARSGTGVVSVFGVSRPSPHRGLVQLAAPSVGPSAGTVDLHLSVDAGSIEVRHAA
ncbi:MAG: hypothetical protein ACRDZQ_08910 [Acidimicrobiales bacterium]